MIELTNEGHEAIVILWLVEVTHNVTMLMPSLITTSHYTGQDDGHQEPQMFCQRFEKIFNTIFSHNILLLESNKISIGSIGSQECPKNIFFLM